MMHVSRLSKRQHCCVCFAETASLQQSWSGAVFSAALLPARCLLSRPTLGCEKDGWSLLIWKTAVFVRVSGYVTDTFRMTASITWGCLTPG